VAANLRIGEKREVMPFKENLLRKIEIDRLAFQVIASCGAAHTRHSVDKEAMRHLLELSPYIYQRERDLDLYAKEVKGAQKMILVLDNDLPIFRTTIKDVVIRKSPRTLEMWSIRTIRNILVDSDIKVSTKGKSVEIIQKDAVAQLDLSYTDADIESLAQEGMAWLAGSNSRGVESILILFAELLGYVKPPEYFGLGNTVSYGIVTSGQDGESVLGPLVLYRAENNTLVWIDESITTSDQQQMGFLRAVATGQASVPVTEDAVFQKLQANVLGRPERVLLV
jgi:hypothetical protein